MRPLALHNLWQTRSNLLYEGTAVVGRLSPVRKAKLLNRQTQLLLFLCSVCLNYWSSAGWTHALRIHQQLNNFILESANVVNEFQTSDIYLSDLTAPFVWVLIRKIKKGNEEMTHPKQAFSFIKHIHVYIFDKWKRHLRNPLLQLFPLFPASPAVCLFFNTCCERSAKVIWGHMSVNHLLKGWPRKRMLLFEWIIKIIAQSPAARGAPACACAAGSGARTRRWKRKEHMWSKTGSKVILGCSPPRTCFFKVRMSGSIVSDWSEA